MGVRVGRADRELSEKLQNAGPEHAKHLRMVIVWADIEAPLYWWKQADCYRMGVEKISCSTMHTLMRRHLELPDFQDRDGIWSNGLAATVHEINAMMDKWAETDDKERKLEIWEDIIRMLPQSFLQKRTVMMSYAALRNICKQRAGHKLGEWKIFREWAQSLPESWMIVDE